MVKRNSKMADLWQRPETLHEREQVIGRGQQGLREWKRARQNVARLLGRIAAAQDELAFRLDGIATQPEHDAEFRAACGAIASWSRAHIAALEPLFERYGRPQGDPERTFSELAHGVRLGGFGPLRGVRDIDPIVTEIESTWSALRAAGVELGDRDLERAASEALAACQRQIQWLQDRAQREQAALDATASALPARAAPIEATIDSDEDDTTGSGVRPTQARSPETGSVPLDAALITLLMGLGALALDTPGLEIGHVVLAAVVVAAIATALRWVHIRTEAERCS